MPLHAARAIGSSVALTVLAEAINLESPATSFLKEGLLGGAIVVLAAVVWILYRDMKAETKKRDAAVAALQENHLKALTELMKQHAIEQTEIQAQRVVDAQEVADRLLKVNEQNVAALTTVVKTMEALEKTMQELRVAFKELGEEMRRSSVRR